MTIKEVGFESIEDYVQVAISFEVRQRCVMLEDWAVVLKPEPSPWVKDYDGYPDEGPRSFASRFDVSNWAVLAAFDESRIVGGAILAFRCPEFELLEGRDDLVHVVDIRVAPESRGQGVGRRLWEAAEAWARQRGATEIRVETQNINVPACRFYQAMGCRLLQWSAEAYGPEVDEAQIIWSKKLGP